MTTTASNPITADTLNDEQKLKKYSKDLYTYTEGLLNNVSADGKQQASSGKSNTLTAAHCT